MANNHSKPTHRVAVAKHYGPNNEKTFWTTIGSAWAIKNGFNIELTAHPIGTKMCIFVNEDNNEDAS